MLKNNPNDLDSTKGNGKTYIYNSEDDTWMNFGGVADYPLVSYDNDGLVYPDLWNRIIEVQQRQKEGMLNNLKLTPEKPYFYMFYSSDGFVKFTPDRNRMIIELNKGAITRRLYRSPCVGPRGATGIKGKAGRNGVPASNEKFRPVYQDGAFDLEVKTPIGDSTPISLRGFTVFEQVFEALLYADGTITDPKGGLTEVKVTGEFKSGKVDVRGILKDPNLRFKIRQVGAQGATGDDGVNYLQVIQEEADTNGQYTEVVGMLRYNSTLNVLTLKQITINELLNNTLSLVPNAGLPSGDNWAAVQISSNPRKDIEYHNYQTSITALPLDLPSYTPLSGCYNQRRYAMGYLQAEDTPFTIITDPFPEYKSCKDPYWFCGNTGDQPCDGLIDVDPNRPNAPFETSSTSTSNSSESSESSDQSSDSSEPSLSSDSSEPSSDSTLPSEPSSDSSDSEDSLSSDSEDSLSSDSSDNDLSSVSSDNNLSSASSNIPSSDSSDVAACVSTVTWTQGGPPASCSLNNYKVIAGVPTITLYFNSCSSVYATYTYSGGIWSQTGYPTICPVTITNVRSNFLDCVGGTPDIELNICLESPCVSCGLSDIITVP